MSRAIDGAEFPRRYVSPDADFGHWAVPEQYYRELAERPLASRAEIEQWLLDFSELESCFDEEYTRRYTTMTCQTDDPDRQARYMQFIEQVQPQREPWIFKLQRKFIEASAPLELPAQRYEVLQRSLRNAVEMFREENIPLETENARMTSEFQQITGAMTVRLDGNELTLQQAGRHLEENDRTKREQVWHLITDRYLEDAERLDALYERMVRLRDRIARNAGCSDYREYQFRAYERFDYTPDDCLRFHDTIERVIVPAARQLITDRRARLGLAEVRPWDLGVDPDDAPPLRPFETVEQLNEGCSRIFHEVSSELGRVFDTLREREVLDLESRKGKAPGGYQATFQERRLPFIFMNAVGTDGDVRTLLHEGGHAFHTWACRNEPWISYRNAPTEFSEVASMGMECLALPYTNVFYGADDRRAHRHFFEKIVLFYPFMAQIDAFQHYVYTHVDEGIEAWKDYWQTLKTRFSVGVEVRGLERAVRHDWHRKLHIFEVPFYYVEYGIAQLGALQVWERSRSNFSEAVALYRNGLALGGARPLPELFEAAGCRFDFSEQTVQPLVDAVMKELERLRA